MARKKKINLNIIVPLICIIVVGITFYMMYDIKNKIENGNMQNAVNVDEVNITNEIISEEDNVLQNKVEENKITENIVTHKIENSIQNVQKNEVINTTTNSESQSSMQSKPATTDKKQRAIELVKQEWGDDETVSYVFDYVNEKGEYIIAVKDKSSATVKYYFRVNLETETVELD